MVAKGIQGKAFNLEEAVETWASQEYDMAATRKMKKLKAKKRLQTQIDWTMVISKDETQWPKIAQSAFNEEEGDSNANEKALTSPQLKGALAEMGPNTKASILFQTVFRNNSQSPQDYTMRTEKTTRSSCTTSMETSCTKGIDMCITLKTPCEVFEANAGFHREMTLTNSEGESIEEEMTWGVESHIHVKENHLATAMLVVEEKKYNGNFIVRSTMKGHVLITFVNKKDNSHVYTVSGDLHKIVSDYLEEQRAMNNSYDAFVELHDPSTVVVITQGSCDFRFGIKQQVLVDQHRIQ